MQHFYPYTRIISANIRTICMIHIYTKHHDNYGEEGFKSSVSKNGVASGDSELTKFLKFKFYLSLRY